MSCKNNIRSPYTAQINKYISTTYDDVKLVADNIESVVKVSGNLGGVQAYIGAYGSAPTQRSNGLDLFEGDLYYDTTEQLLKCYISGQWVTINANDFTTVINNNFAITPNYASLKVVAGTDNDISYVLGRAGINDGGEGFFVFKTGDYSTEVAADTVEAIYIAPTADATGSSGAWVRQYEGHKMASWAGIGAAGDNAATLTTLFSEMQAGDVWVFNRDFELASAVTMTSKSDIILDGTGCVITESVTNINGTLTFVSCDNITVKGFEFIGQETAASYAYSDKDTVPIAPRYAAIFFNLCDFCVAEGIRSESGKSGLVLVEGATSNTCVMRHCYHVSLWATEVPALVGFGFVNGAASFDIDNGVGHVVEGCYARGTGDAVLVGNQTEDVKIINNEFIRSYDNIIYVSSCQRAIITGNKLNYNIIGSGIKIREGTLGSSAGSSVVANNTFMNCNTGITAEAFSGGAADSYGAAGGRMIIANNTFGDCAIGINLDNAASADSREIMVVNNYLGQCGGEIFVSGGAPTTSEAHPIRVRMTASAKGIVIDGNIIDNPKDPAVIVAISVTTVGATFNGLHITNNSFRGPWSRCISLHDASDCLVSGNVAQDTDTITFLVYLDTVVDSTISNNIHKLGTVVGLVSSTCSNNLIANNHGASFSVIDASNRTYGNIPESANYRTSIASAPSYIGETALSGGNFYMATGTASSTDWKKITP